METAGLDWDEEDAIAEEDEEAIEEDHVSQTTKLSRYLIISDLWVRTRTCILYKGENKKCTFSIPRIKDKKTNSILLI